MSYESHESTAIRRRGATAAEAFAAAAVVLSVSQPAQPAQQPAAYYANCVVGAITWQIKAYSKAIECCTIVLLLTWSFS